MSSPQRWYPMQGSNAFETTSFMICKSFRIDAGVQAAGTATTVTLPKGSVVFGFRAKVVEAVTSAGAATVQLGFAGTTMLSAATAKTSVDAVGDVVGPDNSADAAVLVLTADDTFDCIVGTAALTAGKFDIDIFYAPPHNVDFDSTFREFVTAALTA